MLQGAGEPNQSLYSAIYSVRPHSGVARMRKNLLPLMPKLTKQDCDNIWFAAWQLRPHVRSALNERGKSAIGFLSFDDVIAVLREAEDKGLLAPIIRESRRLAM